MCVCTCENVCAGVCLLLLTVASIISTLLSLSLYFYSHRFCYFSQPFFVCVAVLFLSPCAHAEAVVASSSNLVFLPNVHTHTHIHTHTHTYIYIYTYISSLTTLEVTLSNGNSRPLSLIAVIIATIISLYNCLGNFCA